MVLTIAKKKTFVFIVVLALNTALAFSQSWGTVWFFSSGLIQYGDNIDRERLELLENRQVVNIGRDARPYTLITGTYTIRNSGEAYQATLGLLFSEIHGIPSPSEMEIKFFVDGELVQHTERVDVGKFIMGDTLHEFLPGISTAWALIDVLFPENSTVTIQVQHTEGSLRYNAISEIGTFVNLDYWRGPTKFSLEVINGPERIGGWIESIHFFHATDSRRDINTRAYLRNLQSLQTDLMSIQRVNGNTFRIDFTEEFSNSFHRRFFIDLRSFADIEAWSFLYFSYPDREISLQGVDVTRQELGRYQLVFLTNAQLRIMRNVFFARHGFIFQSADLIDIFTNWFFHPMPSFVFYVPNPNFHESVLTDTERANIATIQRLEALVGD